MHLFFEKGIRGVTFFTVLKKIVKQIVKASNHMIVKNQVYTIFI